LPPRSDLNRLLSLTARDKKSVDGVVHYTLPVSIGGAITGIPLSGPQVRASLRAWRSLSGRQTG
jgi:hypothetical protein